MVMLFISTIVSFSNFLQKGQSISENTAILRSPLPLTTFIAISNGRLLKLTLVNSSNLALVKSTLVIGFTNLPSIIKKEKDSSEYTI